MSEPVVRCGWNTVVVGRPRLNKGPCAVDDCRDAAVTRGWCKKHYHRWQRHGDPMKVLKEQGLWGTNVGKTCSVEGCDKKAEAKGWCDRHYTRWKRHGDVEALRWRTGPLPEETKAKLRAAAVHLPRGPEAYGWQGDDVTYRGAHTRVKLLRGLAEEHVCRCGDPAKEWAYNHKPVDSSVIRLEGVSRKGRSWQVPYSPNVDDYVALCRSCHVRLDQGLIHAA